MKAYHATARANVPSIQAVGFQLDAWRTHDPGDFGWGFYATQVRERAGGIGGALLLVDLPLQRPLTFPTIAAAYDWVDAKASLIGSNLIHGTLDERVAASKKLRDLCLAEGIDGLVIHDGPGRVGYELVSYTAMHLAKVLRA